MIGKLSSQAYANQALVSGLNFGVYQPTLGNYFDGFRYSSDTERMRVPLYDSDSGRLKMLKLDGIERGQALYNQSLQFIVDGINAFKDEERFYGLHVMPEHDSRLEDHNEWALGRMAILEHDPLYDYYAGMRGTSVRSALWMSLYDAQEGGDQLIQIAKTLSSPHLGLAEVGLELAASGEFRTNYTMELLAENEDYSEFVNLPQGSTPKQVAEHVATLLLKSGFHTFKVRSGYQVSETTDSPFSSEMIYAPAIIQGGRVYVNEEVLQDSFYGEYPYIIAENEDFEVVIHLSPFKSEESPMNRGLIEFHSKNFKDHLQAMPSFFRDLVWKQLIKMIESRTTEGILIEE